MKNITREEALELWLTTLEQHPERKTEGVLGTTSNKFCCLGQLCHLIYEEDEIVAGDHLYYYGEQEEGEELPDEVVEFMGFLGKVGDLDETVTSKENRFFSLADMNDSGTDWPTIAKFIRENPDKVFKNGSFGSGQALDN